MTKETRIKHIVLTWKKIKGDLVQAIITKNISEVNVPMRDKCTKCKEKASTCVGFGKFQGPICGIKKIQYPRLVDF